MNKRIIYQNSDGGVSIIVPAGAIEDCIKDVPAGKAYEIVSAEAVPADRTFRNAWEVSGSSIRVNIDKAKAIAHDKRRAARSAEFAPLDIQATIPANAQIAEAARQQVRDKYDAMQTAIDAATTAEAVKAAMP